MECIDSGYGLDLFADGDDCFTVQLEDDPSVGASLTFAHREGFAEGNSGETHTFTQQQRDMISSWFEEYEA